MLQAADVSKESEPGEVVQRLINQMGISALIRLIADVTHEEADRLLMAGDRQSAANHMREFRVVQRAADQLRR